MADANGRHNSGQTLTEDGDEDEEGGQTTKEQHGSQPNFWFGIRRKLREPLAE